MKKTNIRMGDTVMVIAGNDKGRTGKVVSIHDDSVVVEGVNVRTKHVKRSQEYPKGRRINVEKPVHISNVRLSIEDAPAKLSVRFSEKGKELWHKKPDGSSVLYRVVKERKN